MCRGIVICRRSKSTKFDADLFELPIYTPQRRKRGRSNLVTAVAGVVCDAFVGFVGAAVIERVPELFPNLGQSRREMKDLLHESSPSRLRLGKFGLQPANFTVSFVVGHRSPCSIAAIVAFTEFTLPHP